MNKFRKYIKIATIAAPLAIDQLTTFSQNNSPEYIDNKGQLNYSSLDYWHARKVKKSFMLSGKTIDLYGVGIVDSQSDYYDTKLKDSRSPWGTTNISRK